MGKSPEEGIKAPVKTSTTTQITLFGTGQTLNGVLTGTGDRVLVKDQTVDAENGTYLVGPDAWERTTDMNAADDLANGQLIVDSNTNVLYSIIYSGAWDPGATPLNFIVLLGAMPASISLTSNSPIDLVDHDVPLNIGALDPSISPHLEFDFQGIQSKADDTTAAPLFLNALGSYVRAPQFIAGDPGFEAAGIVIGGVTYQSALKASDLGGTNVAAFIMHRHHDTLPGILVGSRSRGSTGAHVIVADNDTLLSIMAVGWDGTDYEQGAQIRFQVDGTPADNDMPGRITFLTVPAGATVPIERMRIHSTGLVEVFNGFTSAGDINLTGDLILSGLVDGVDLAAFEAAMVIHVGDASIHFTEASITITASQVSDFDTEVGNHPDVVANTAKVTNVPTALSIGTHAIATLGITSDGGADDVVLPSFTATLSGVIPGSGGGTVNFMRADGTWATPPGGGNNLVVVTETTTARTAVAWECVLVDDDTAAGVVTITLPPSVADEMVVVKKIGSSFDVIVDGDTAETIDGAATFTLTSQYASLTLIADGTGWNIV